MLWQICAHMLPFSLSTSAHQGSSQAQGEPGGHVTSEKKLVVCVAFLKYQNKNCSGTNLFGNCAGYKCDPRSLLPVRCTVSISHLFFIWKQHCFFIPPIYFNLWKNRDLKGFFLFHLRIQQNSVFVTLMMNQAEHLPANICRGFWSLCLLQAQ